MTHLILSRVIVVSLLLITSGTADVASEELELRFSKEARKGWAILEEQAATIAGRADIISEGTAPGRGEWRIGSQAIFKQNGDWQLVETIPSYDKNKAPKSVTPPLVFGANSRYGFKLARNDNGDAWLISEASTQYRQAGFASKGFAATMSNALEAAFAVETFISLADMLNAEGFSRGQLRTATLDDGNCVEFDFKFVPKEGARNNNIQEMSGSLCLDPFRQWAMRHYNIVAKGHAIQPAQSVPVTIRIAGDIAYHTDSSLELIPKRVRVERDYGSSQGRSVTTVTLSDVRLIDLPESEFMLAAYGLPEIVKPARLSTSRVWMLIASFVLVFAVGFWLFIRAFRRRQVS